MAPITRWFSDPRGSPPTVRALALRTRGTIYNGGDLSGLVRKIHWHHWGSKKALATGRNHIFKPHGGYYPHPVRIRLTASGLGHCPGSRHRAYRKLHVRVPKKPGGQLGPWRKWAGSKTICKLSF